MDTPSLCGRVREGRGWDITVEITWHNLTMTACPACKEIFERETQGVVPLTK